MLLTDSMKKINRQTRDDAVTRERLFLQQQQMFQRNYAERECKLIAVQKEKELVLTEKQKNSLSSKTA